jgi:hypothetical protein
VRCRRQSASAKRSCRLDLGRASHVRTRAGGAAVNLPSARCHIEGQPTVLPAAPGDGERHQGQAGSTGRAGLLGQRIARGCLSFRIAASILRSPVVKKPVSAARAGLPAWSNGAVSKRGTPHGDRGFESPFLQRRVACEPEFSGGHRIDPDPRKACQNIYRRGSRLRWIGVIAYVVPLVFLYSNARIWCLTHRRCRSGCACRSSASTLRTPAEQDGFELSIPLGWNNGSGPLRSTLGASTLPLKELIDFVRAQ